MVQECNKISTPSKLCLSLSQVASQFNSRFKTTSRTFIFMQTRSQAKSSSSFSSMPSAPIPIANICKEIIVEENFPSDIAPEVVEKIEPKVEPDVEDKSTSISVDNLVSPLGNPQSWRRVAKLGNLNPSQGKTLRN